MHLLLHNQKNQAPWEEEKNDEEEREKLKEKEGRKQRNLAAAEKNALDAEKDKIEFI